MKFNALEIEPTIQSAIDTMGFEEMTPIQEKTVPLGLSGKDVIGQAQTGTGKTVAFGIPLIEKIDKQNKAVQALVIAPTRELAIQSQEELYHLGRDKGVRVQSIYGGASIGQQIKNLKQHPDIIVGTPGRLRDHLRRGTLDLTHLSMFVLDEADEMLNMGFIEDIEAIIAKLPDHYQTLLFSATMPKEVKTIALKIMDEPVTVQIETRLVASENVTQYYTRAKDYEKFDFLTRFIDIHTPNAAIVFARTKRRVDEIAEGLKRRGYNADGIHGDLSQAQRMNILKGFKAGNIDILVATDVAARGLDISSVTHVYNYDVPQDPESYVHRIGRTGRAGEKGMSVTFVTPNEMGYLRTIENLTKQEMSPLRPPTDEEAVKGQIDGVVDSIKERIASNDLSKYQKESAELLEQFTAEEIAAAYIQSHIKDPNDIPVKITPERPLSKKHHHGGHGGKNKRNNHRNNRGKGNHGRGGSRRGQQHHHKKK